MPNTGTGAKGWRSTPQACRPHMTGNHGDGETAHRNDRFDHRTFSNTEPGNGLNLARAHDPTEPCRNPRLTTESSSGMPIPDGSTGREA